jgi:hypothetical protein
LGKGGICGSGKERVADEAGCENLEVEVGGTDGSLRTGAADVGAGEDVSTVNEIRSVEVISCGGVAALPDGGLSMGNGTA